MAKIRRVPAGQQLIVRMRIKPTVKATRSAMATAFDKVAAEIERDIKRKISRPGPPPSRPGAHPKKDSGLLHNTLSVTRKGREIQVRTQSYGQFLETGTRNMAARPFIHRNLTKRKRHWSKRITAHAKAAMKTKR